MSVRMVVSGFLRETRANKSDILCNGGTVEEVIFDAISQRPEIKPYLLDKSNQLNVLVSIYINKTHIGVLQGIQTKVKSGDEIAIVPLISGG